MTAPERLDPEVEAAVTPPPLDYGGPLRVAWQWNRSGDPADLRKAEQLLALLTAPGEFEFALPVWYERAFNLVRQKRPGEAVRLLERIAVDFQHSLDRDTVALWGRILKDRGYARLDAGDLAGAERAFADAEAAYLRGFRSARDYFPGINVATLRFLRASLLRQIAEAGLRAGGDATGVEPALAGRDAAAELLSAARTAAAELAAASGEWEDKLQDDAVWRLATLGEADVLLGRWADAELAYRTALTNPAVPLQPFHPESIARQLRRLVAAYPAFGVQPPPPFDDPVGFVYGLALSFKRPDTL
jgi:hypothetical protein